MKPFPGNPLLWIVAYFGVIIAFSFAYAVLPNGSFSTDLSWGDAFYFSVVTITTLGYGEIHPLSTSGKLFVSAEAIAGIIAIGLFLNSLWHKFTTSVEAGQRRQVKESLRQNNLKSLAAAWSYLQSLIVEYRLTLYELTTPLSARKGDQVFNADYMFADLRDLYYPSMSLKRDTQKSIIYWFYNVEREMADDIRSLLGNPLLSEFDSVRGIAVELLTTIRTTDVSDALLENVNLKAGDKAIKVILSDMISKQEAQPKIEDFQSNLLTPVIILDAGIRAKAALISALEDQVLGLLKEIA